ncbi:SulP family inorganic anion transporter [Candidatus Villigracilis saccharophilus]|uniref:SulP family inorganic anion transporter n=1 Tax=Candidatus Villigracilis saccharophilus TaxID=3140684 RepID=UPI0031EF827C
MSAVIMLLVQKYGLTGIWVAGLMAGIFLTIIGLLRLGRFIAFIPSPVITGFTSGIALIIFIGQMDNFLGVKTTGADSAALKFIGYFKGGFIPDWHAIVLAGIVILTMVLWPVKWNAKFPASLLGIILATVLNAALNWPVKMIGVIPQTLFLADRMNFSMIPWANLGDFVAPALTITALGAIESLLCGAVGSNMTGIRLQANQELIAQGLGNILIPFFGGVPATAAIARASVGIKSGGQTRLVSIIHAVGLLLSMFVLAPLMARIPLAGLAGVLMVTAWRMNEWEGIRFIFSHRFKTAMITFGITLIATITLDLTQAILVGAFLSGAMF